MYKRLFLLLGLFMAVGMTLHAGTASKKFTLVIDAGHGGRDHGAPGAFSKEKDLTLKFALAFGKMVERNCPDVDVVYTRTTDVFVELGKRAEIANRHKADLFISVHINAVEGGRNVHGFQTYTLGKGRRSGSNRGIVQNLEVAKRENAVIFLEKDYRQVYKGFDDTTESNIMYEFIADKNRERSVDLAKMMQTNVCAATGRQNGGAHQDNLAVLRLTSMPGCLVECGFISTPDEEQFMNSEVAEDLYAKGLYNAFIQYKNKYDVNLVVPYKAMPVTPQIPQVVPEQYKPDPKNEVKVENEKKPETKNSSKEKKIEDVEQTENKSNEATGAEDPVFKIQIFSGSNKLPDNSPLLKGLSPCERFEEGGLYKYTYGSSTDYNEIYRLRKTLLNDFPDAFIVAYQGKERVDVRKAIAQFKQKKKQ